MNTFNDMLDEALFVHACTAGYLTEKEFYTWRESGKLDHVRSPAVKDVVGRVFQAVYKKTHGPELDKHLKELGLS